MRRTAALAAVLLAVLVAALTGCGRDRATAPPQVRVNVGGQEVDLRPTQYCLDGKGQRYDTAPPIIEVSPDTPIALTVPDAVAQRGWSVQVFDEKLQQQLGEVEVDKGAAVFDKISTSDVVPAAFYLVVVEHKGSQCQNLSGAWPVGFIRAGGEQAATPSPSPTSP